MSTFYIPCHTVKLTYVQNPKAANSSIIHSLNKLEGWFDTSITKHQRMQNKVRRFKIYRRKHEKEFNDYIKFSFVRDPYTRLCSAFINKVLQPKKVFYGFTRFGVTKLTSFLEFCQIIKDRSPKLEIHVKPQSMILPSDLDYVGKIETIKHDWKQIKERWAKDLQEIEHINKSAITIAPESLLCNDSIKIINDVYREDFTRFNYKFKNTSSIKENEHCFSIRSY